MAADTHEILSEKLWQLMLMMPARLGFSVRSSGS